MGNTRASECGTGNQYGSHAFFIPFNHQFNATSGGLWHNTIMNPSLNLGKSTELLVTPMLLAVNRDIDKMWLVNFYDVHRLSSIVAKCNKNAGQHSFDLKPCKRTPVKKPEFLFTNFSKLP